MPISYRIDAPLGILRIEVVGSPSFEEQVEVYGRYRRDPGYVAGTPILIDDRRREGAAETSEVRAIAKGVSEARGDFEGVPCAILVARDAQYGMSRMFAALSEKSGMLVRIFRDEDEAVAWLRGEDPAGEEPDPAPGSAC